MEIPSFCTRTTVFGGIRLCRIALDLVANWMRIPGSTVRYCYGYYCYLLFCTASIDDNRHDITRIYSHIRKLNGLGEKEPVIVCGASTGFGAYNSSLSCNCINFPFSPSSLSFF